MCRCDLLGQFLSGLRQLGVKLETGAGENCSGTDLVEVCVVRQIQEDTYRVRVAAEKLSRQHQFGGFPRSDAPDEGHLRAMVQLGGACECDMDRGLSRVARVVIGGNDQAVSQKSLRRCDWVQPFEERSIDLPSVEDNRARLRIRYRLHLTIV